MKKIGAIFKEFSENRIKSELKSSESVFVIKYSGLSGPDLNVLRQSLKVSRANLFVVKNAVARRAFKDSGLEPILQIVEGPCGLIFAKDEPVTASKVLRDFSKDHENLKIEGGFLKDKVLNKKDIEALASLPSKDVLRAQVVMTLNAPISKFARVLNQTLRKFVYCLDQIKQKKSA